MNIPGPGCDLPVRNETGRQGAGGKKGAGIGAAAGGVGGLIFDLITRDKK